MSAAAVPVQHQIVSFLAFLVLLLLAIAFPSHAERKFPGRGAISALDFTKLTSSAEIGTTHPNLYFSDVLQNPENTNSPSTFYITEDGHTQAIFTIDQQQNIVVHSGTVEDGTVQDQAREKHVVHIHQLHFQVLDVDIYTVVVPGTAAAGRHHQRPA